MKIELEANTLGQAFKALMMVRHKTYRDVGEETGVNYPAVWRFADRP